ncbi:MAG TPA: cystathionine gamma-lyase [Pyrinomonadaceae bacterium]|jgi:cystathionine gamma-lyase
MKNGTKVIHAGGAKKEQGAAFSDGITFASNFFASGEPADIPYTYGRYHNPTWTNFETALTELEGGKAVCFASGMAAVAAVFGSVLRRGDLLVVPSDSYYTTRLLADGFFAGTGVRVRQAPTAGEEIFDALDGAKLVWLETPANPSLDVCDIEKIARAAHEKGALVAVDNTTATVLGQNPLSLGADFSVASDTKNLSGHSDLMLGHVAATDEKLLQKIIQWRTQIGAIPGPMEVWLAHRGLKTLELRLERQKENCLAAAEFLKNHPKVSDLRYPGLPTDKSYPVAAKQMKYFGSVVSFVLEAREAADKFLTSCRLVSEATSFGGLHSTAERRARWGGDSVADGFIRFSVGCENAEDIIEDIQNALAAI